MSTSVNLAGLEAELVDERFGVVRQLRADQRTGGMPAGQHQWVAHVADTSRYGAPPVDRIGFGNATEASRARSAALGEAVERYCGNLVPTDLFSASWHDLQRCGRTAVDPATLALFSVAQYASRGFPFVPFTRDTQVPWVLGTRLADGAPTLVPASLVYLNLRVAPPTNPLAYAGIATGRSVVEAETAALYEVLERDATSIWWAANGPSLAVRDAGAEVHQFDDLDLEHRSVRVLAVPNSVDLPVIAAFVEDHRRSLIGFGTACRAAVRDAVIKALTEAFGLLEVAADLADLASPLWDACRQGLFPPGLFRPWRADRSYSDAYRSDFRDLWDLPSVVQLYLDPELRCKLVDRLRRQDGTTTLAELDRAGADQLADLVARCTAVNLHPISVDVTTEDVARAGLRVVRVMVPGTYSNSPPAFPLLGGLRLRAVPRHLGWPARCVAADEQLVQIPIPLG